MEFSTVILIIGSLFGLSAVIAAAFLISQSARSRNRVRGMVSGVMASSASEATIAAKRQTRVFDAEEIKKQSRDATRQKLQTTQFISRESLSSQPDATSRQLNAEQAKFFQAGIFTQEDKANFRKLQFAAPVVCLFLALILLVYLNASVLKILLGGMIGLLVGVTLPKTILEKAIRARTEETLRHLPITIEQISIGVSSSLDLWPCISHIIGMARERDSFNPVIELFINCEKLIMSGLNFQDALIEVGQASGIQQIKHCFAFLAQCAQHGGEISKQLQELANSVMSERQTEIEGKISSLPVKATGPLFFVFSGFFTLMLSGIFIKIITSIKTS